MKTELSPGILTISHCFTPQECQAYIARSEAVGYEAATIQTQEGAVLDMDFRNNERLHEGRTVSSGAKYVLRSDEMFDRVGRISG